MTQKQLIFGIFLIILQTLKRHKQGRIESPTLQFPSHRDSCRSRLKYLEWMEIYLNLFEYLVALSPWGGHPPHMGHMHVPNPCVVVYYEECFITTVRPLLHCRWRVLVVCSRIVGNFYVIKGRFLPTGYNNTTVIWYNTTNGLNVNEIIKVVYLYIEIQKQALFFQFFFLLKSSYKQ